LSNCRIKSLILSIEASRSKTPGIPVTNRPRDSRVPITVLIELETLNVKTDKRVTLNHIFFPENWNGDWRKDLDTFIRYTPNLELYNDFSSNKDISLILGLDKRTSFYLFHSLRVVHMGASIIITNSKLFLQVSPTENKIKSFLIFKGNYLE